MALSNGKYKGKSLSVTIGATEYNMDLKSITLTNEEGDDDATTFADLAAGGSVQWFFEGEAVSDYGTGSLWNYIWANSGTNDVAFVFKPYGNAVAAPGKPHFTGTLNVGAKPPVGGEANETFAFEFRFDVNNTPVMKVS